MKAHSLTAEFDWDRYERVVVLSPHIDDAVLSCSSLLSALDPLVERQVVTLYCGNPELPLTTGGRNKPRVRPRRGYAPPRLRRREDIEVMRFLGCDWVHLGFPDAIYRRSPRTGRLIYRHPRQRWTAPNPEDSAHVEELFMVLYRLCGNMGPRLLISPMGIGYHVDHRICAMAALRLANRHTQVIFYEDFPYVVDMSVGGGEPDDPATALARLGLEPKRRYFVPIDTERQIEALRRYASQIGPLFGDEAKMRKAVLARKHLGKPSEFFWRARPLRPGPEDRDGGGKGGRGEPQTKPTL